MMLNPFNAETGKGSVFLILVTTPNPGVTPYRSLTIRGKLYDLIVISHVWIMSLSFFSVL